MKKKPPPELRIPDPPSAEVLAFPSKVRAPPKQVELSEDGEFVSVLDMLYALIEDIEDMDEKDRPTGVFVGMYKDNMEKGFEHFPYYNYGLTRLELLGLLTQFQRSVI